MFSLNNKVSPKYDLAPQQILDKSLNKGSDFEQVFDFKRLQVVGKARERTQRYAENIDSKRQKLKSLLNVAEKVLVLASRLRKKDEPGNLYKGRTENRPFYNREKVFTIKNTTKIDGVYYYWLENTSGKFLREELFALNNQFQQRWSLFQFTLMKHQ